MQAVGSDSTDKVNSENSFPIHVSSCTPGEMQQLSVPSDGSCWLARTKAILPGPSLTDLLVMDWLLRMTAISRVLTIRRGWVAVMLSSEDPQQLGFLFRRGFP